MKVLWTVNIMFPEAKALLEGKPSAMASSGGWLVGAAASLCEKVELHIACPAAVPATQILQGEKIVYHLFPGLQPCGEPFYGDNPELDSVFNNLIDWLRPDLIDIHGTEYAHSFSCLRAAGEIPCVVTIQGLLYECAAHYTDGLSRWTILSHKRPFKAGILQEEESFRLRGEVEKELLSRARNFIGRTAWDKAETHRQNPEARYFHCDAILRDEFYDGCWDHDKCTPHRIFISQASYPIKGLHQLLRALPLVIRRYPDTSLHIAGSDFISGKKKRLGNYARIIRSLIKCKRLKDHISFSGQLTAAQMKEEFLEAEVFIAPSTIENESNSLSEAQILGVPCIASRRGGMTTTVSDPRMGSLYDFDDIKGLAESICHVFETAADFDNGPMREMALRRHDKAANCAKLLDIYKDIISSPSEVNG